MGDPVDHVRHLVTGHGSTGTINAGDRESGSRRGRHLCVHAMSVHSYTLRSRRSDRQVQEKLGEILDDEMLSTIECSPCFASAPSSPQLFS